MTTIYKLLLYGARDWDDMSIIEREFLDVLDAVRAAGRTELVVIEGEAPGADIMARIVAHKNNCHVARVDALWETRYRAAGPQRNNIMRLLEPDEAIGFHRNITKSKGTKDMKRQLERAGITNRIVSR